MKGTEGNIDEPLNQHPLKSLGFFTFLSTLGVGFSVFKDKGC